MQVRTLWVIFYLTVTSASAFAAAAPSHCSAKEESLWSCSSKKKIYEICVSKDLGIKQGYMQYRAGQPGKPAELVFPTQLVPPKGLFKVDMLPRGVMLSFTHQKELYEINEPLSGSTTISAAKEGQNSSVAVTCDTASDTLTLTPTLNRFKSLGIYGD